MDVHGAFRGSFSTAADNTTLEIAHTGVSWYNVWLDGALIAEGPTRFTGDTPWSALTTVSVPKAGAHVLAIHAHSSGVQTRTLLKNPGVVWCIVTDVTGQAPQALAVSWKCKPLPYAPRWNRVSALLGWCEKLTLESWLSVNNSNSCWTSAAFAADASWVAPSTGALVAPSLKPPVPLQVALSVGPADSCQGDLLQVRRRHTVNLTVTLTLQKNQTVTLVLNLALQ